MQPANHVDLTGTLTLGISLMPVCSPYLPISSDFSVLSCFQNLSIQSNHPLFPTCSRLHPDRIRDYTVHLSECKSQLKAHAHFAVRRKVKKAQWAHSGEKQRTRRLITCAKKACENMRKLHTGIVFFGS